MRQFDVKFTRYGNGVREQSGAFSVKAETFDHATGVGYSIVSAMNAADPDREYEIAEIRASGLGGPWHDKRGAWESYPDGQAPTAARLPDYSQGWNDGHTSATDAVLEWLEGQPQSVTAGEVKGCVQDLQTMTAKAPA